MAKSKWEQLHSKMNTIMKDIEEYIQMIKNALAITMYGKCTFTESC